ncbi:MAG TPA: SDR family NAD(P)-dependent oxidoreductase, partial [Mycobacterium sp.]|nr:SDR family NAD(P)-dependent oxidoreductase [Mycobacterium sp.]
MPFDTSAFRLDDKVTVVTGAGAGIGRAVAALFASAGASVVVSDLDAAAAQAVADEIADTSGRAVATGCDVTTEADLERLVSLAVDRFGGVDILAEVRLFHPPYRTTGGVE